MSEPIIGPTELDVTMTRGGLGTRAIVPQEMASQPERLHKVVDMMLRAIKRAEMGSSCQKQLPST